jgi:hypothetical protein
MFAMGDRVIRQWRSSRDGGHVRGVDVFKVRRDRIDVGGSGPSGPDAVDQGKDRVLDQFVPETRFAGGDSLRWDDGLVHHHVGEARRLQPQPVGRGGQEVVLDV